MAALQLLRDIAARPHINTVDQIRSVIDNEHPPPYTPFRLRLCLLSAKVFNNGQGIHADFVDEDIAAVFTDFKEEFEMTASAQRLRLVFRLTVWGPRHGSPFRDNHFQFNPGEVLELDQVVSLSTWKNLCQGTCELARVRRADNTAN